MKKISLISLLALMFCCLGTVHTLAASCNVARNELHTVTVINDLDSNINISAHLISYIPNYGVSNIANIAPGEPTTLTLQTVSGANVALILGGFGGPTSEGPFTNNAVILASSFVAAHPLTVG